MDLTAKILKGIEEKQSKEHRAYIGCSSIGHPCSRYLWYAYHNAPSIDDKPSIKISFDIGKRLESMILDYIEEAGITVIRPHEANHQLLCRDNEIPQFQGHMDAIIVVEDEYSVVDIKTAKSSQFQAFVKKGLKAWSPIYYAQIQSYMGMRNYKKAVIVAINKDSSEIHHEWVDFDSYFYNELRAKAASIHEAEEPPERINKNPTYILCSRCKYKDTCFFKGLGGLHD